MRVRHGLMTHPLIFYSYHNYQNIFSPKREINSCLRSFGKLQSQNAHVPMLDTLLGMAIVVKEKQN